MTKNALALLLLICLPFSAICQSDLQQPFKDCRISGSITVYDLKNDRWTFSDQADARRETLPASTFKIINSLIALETGAVKDEHVVLKWDGIERFVPAWNADTDMEKAFQNSTVWFYVEMAKRIGLQSYARYLSACRYGNGQIHTGKNNDFWNYGKFGITPENQITFLKDLYEENLPFSARTYQKVKRIMIAEETPEYILRAKTGWTWYGGKDTGWYVGYVEKQDNVWFFATRIVKDREDKNENFASCRIEISKKVLKELGAL